MSLNRSKTKTLLLMVFTLMMFSFAVQASEVVQPHPQEQAATHINPLCILDWELEIM